MTSVYYNEIDAYCAQWLRNLMDAGLIPAGDIDTRSIEDVRPDELRGYTQCHFFAGLGGWAYALELAGWGTRPVWTGSCPCQPFSAAGKGAGFDDERHLWPAFHHLIRECRPTVVFGEQVASKDADTWIDLVHADLENVDYAFGCVPFPAAGIRAPHIRDRNYWLADAHGTGSQPREWNDSPAGHRHTAATTSDPGWLADTNCRTGGQGGSVNGWRHTGSDAQSRSGLGGNVMPHSGNTGPLDGFWRDADWLLCRDGKWRPVEPGTFPLAHGIPARVGRLRAYGNAIVAPQAAEFVTAYLQARGLITDQQAVSA